MPLHMHVPLAPGTAMHAARRGRHSHSSRHWLDSMFMLMASSFTPAELLAPPVTVQVPSALQQQFVCSKVSSHSSGSQTGGWACGVVVIALPAGMLQGNTLL